HCSNGRFVVTTTLVRSYAVLITSNSSSAPTLLAGTYPSSSSTSKSRRASCVFSRNSTRSSRASNSCVTSSVTRQNRTRFPRRHPRAARRRPGVRLPAPGAPQEDPPPPPVDDLPPHQRGDEPFFRGRRGGEVEAPRGLPRGNPGSLDPPLGRPPLPVYQLQLG